jgi:transposase
MLALHAGMRVHLALGATDMRKGFDGLAAQVQTVLKADPFSGHLFLFRGKRGDLLKALWWDGQGWCCWPSGSRRAGSYGRRSRARAW